VIAKIERYIAGMTYEEFQADDLKIDAVLGAIFLKGLNPLLNFIFRPNAILPIGVCLN
jgi:hypothetical protein